MWSPLCLFLLPQMIIIVASVVVLGKKKNDFPWLIQIQSQVLACFYMVLKTRHGTSQAIHRNCFDSCGQAAARDTQPLNHEWVRAMVS